MGKVIEAENLGFAYGGEMVFSGVEFTVDEGDFVAVIGSNGAGKSTLMRLMLGELAPTEGRVKVFGEDAVRFKGWPRIGYVPQNAARTGQDFPASVREIVEANLYGQAGLFRLPGRALKQRAADALKLVGMEDFEKRPIGQLSGGQQQRVMLARVLAGQPEALLLDEPTSGVDAKTVDALYELLTRLNREKGMTIVLVTHDVARASRLASRVVCLEEGSLVELPPNQVKEELEHKHKHPGGEDKAIASAAIASDAHGGPGPGEPPEEHVGEHHGREGGHGHPSV
jgi:zinc transport system ATP-binding protein